LGRVEPNLAAAIHPSAFSQLLVGAIRELLDCVSPGQILVVAEQAEGHVEITLTGHRPAARARSAGVSLESTLVREILASYGGDVDITSRPDSVSLVVKLPSVDRCVLVVDDNSDMIHLYRRYVAGTRYHIVHTAQGQRVLEAIQVSAPDVIVLDVMLPDINGWELLGHLRDNPASRSIPIVVCSVVREEELALELGAARHLTKPVQRQQFLQALDQALSQAPAGASRAAGCSAAAC
jgi:CheY-like chemotaxis protein